MLYYWLKYMMRLALTVFYRKRVFTGWDQVPASGPVIFACNHPNSFLDAIILDTLFDAPIYSLARGDVFRKRMVRKLLLSLKILPVYRTSEGAGNLQENYKTFDGCMSIFRQNGAVLIFSEGKCINEWHLRKLKKGTARLAFKAWQEGIPLKVIPVGINYNSFKLSGKNVFVNFGEACTEKDILSQGSDGARNVSFNNRLVQQLSGLVYEIDPQDVSRKQALLTTTIPWYKKILLFFPAVIGWITHLPLYISIKQVCIKYFRHTDHYDSAVFTLLFLLYPFCLLLLSAIVYYITGNPWSWVLPLVLPFCAYATIQLKPQLDKR